MKNLFLLATLGSAFGGEIADYHDKHARDATNRPAGLLRGQPKELRSYSEVISTNHGVAEIGIERVGSVWGGPTYTFIAKSDGTFPYKGEKDVERTGEFTGTVSLSEFSDLAKFIRDSGYMKLQSDYRQMVSDADTAYTSVMLDGERKVIRNYSNTGPTKLWAIEQLIDDLMRKAPEWKSGLPKAPAPVLPTSTRYDSDPVLRIAYLESYRKGFADAWDRKEKLPVFGPANDADKARVLGYADGMVAGRAALAKWQGMDGSTTNQASGGSIKR